VSGVPRVCPAATGIGQRDHRCLSHDDGAHRCNAAETHISEGDADHLCLCGLTWLTWSTAPRIAQRIPN
jgi:hypothetical protein